MGGCALAVALMANKMLAQLDLGGNELGAESGKALGEALKMNTTLTNLSLNSNKLGDASGCARAVALQTNTTLTQLDLSDNELGAESGEAIVEALKTNTTLSHLDLGRNVLRSFPLVEALKTNTTLTQLNVGDNLIDGSLVASLKSLASIKLSVNLGELCSKCGSQEGYVEDYHDTPESERQILQCHFCSEIKIELDPGHWFHSMPHHFLYKYNKDSGKIYNVSRREVYNRTSSGTSSEG